MATRPPSESPDPAVPADGTDAQAKAYEAAQNRLFVLQTILTVAVLAVFFFSGASVRLAEGLRHTFSAGWAVNGCYILLSVFGFSAVLFPLSYYSGHVLETHYGLSRQDFGGWFWDYLKSLGLEMLLALVFFEFVYAVLHFFPSTWWLFATLFYVFFAVVLGALAPVLILPLFHKYTPLEDETLCGAVREFAERAGLKVVGVYRWGLEEKTQTANAALAGLGRTRRILLGDTMLQRYTPEEIIAVLAHELGHYRHRDLTRMLAVGSALAAGGFYLAHRALGLLGNALSAWGVRGLADVGGFPVFLFVLFVFSLLVMPLLNAYSRRREYRADAYAVRALGTAAPLASALEKLARQNLAERDPPAWIEALLHSHPSIRRRVEAARAVEQTLGGGGGGDQAPLGSS